jgi:predicted HTH domain antitoxin
MKTLTINIPDNVDLNAGEARLMLAIKLFEKGKLTIGQAAEIAGFSKRVFMEITGDYDVSPINSAIEDIENDVNNARNYSV